MSTSEDELGVRAQARLGSVLGGKYRLDRVLGVGGMATVYAATHRNGKEVAVKILHPELSLSPEVRTRFLREGYVANSVKHRGAVDVADDDVSEDGAAFIVMELLEGDSIEDLSTKQGGRLPLDVVVGITFQLLDVLSAAHARGVIHRDIKPANIFLTREGQVKVLDFGIARLRDFAASKATQTGMMLGTPAFMAPEQAAGRTSDVDPQTDLYAVGATMFTLASGRLVNDGDNAQQIMIRAATTPAQSFASVMPDAPAALVAVIDQALAFQKAERWANARAMREALRNAALASFGAVRSAASLRELVGGSARLPDSATMPSAGSAPESQPRTPDRAGPERKSLDDNVYVDPNVLEHHEEQAPPNPASLEWPEVTKPMMDAPPRAAFRAAPVEGLVTAEPVSNGLLPPRAQRVARPGSVRIVVVAGAVCLAAFGGAAVIAALRDLGGLAAEATHAAGDALASTASAVTPPPNAVPDFSALPNDPSTRETPTVEADPLYPEGTRGGVGHPKSAAHPATATPQPPKNTPGKTQCDDPFFRDPTTGLHHQPLERKPWCPADSGVR